jgi:metal-responsive CopG/Arc/MetJ family transcriptional regulator
MAKVKIDSALLERARAAAQTAGYSSVDEFITHIVEKELAKYETSQDDQKTAEKLRGLGYIE